MATATLTRIGHLFERCRSENRKAFIAYLTAGDPNPEATVPLVLALERGGADLSKEPRPATLQPAPRRLGAMCPSGITRGRQLPGITPRP